LAVWVGATDLRENRQPRPGTSWSRSFSSVDLSGLSSGSDALFISSLNGWSNADGAAADPGLLGAHWSPKQGNA
jgi:hypothetical protein